MQEEGQESLQLEVNKGILIPVTCVRLYYSGIRFSEAVSKIPISLCWSGAVYMRCLMWSCVNTLLPIISHQRSRWWSEHKLGIQLPLFFFHTCFVLLADESLLWGGLRRIMSIWTGHTELVSVIRLLPTPWKTLERRLCLLTTFTEGSAVFQCLLGKAQLNVEAGIVLMFVFFSSSFQSRNIRRLKSLSFLEFCHFTHYLDCPRDFMTQESMHEADLRIIKGGKLCQIGTWIKEEFSHLTSVSLVS